jgi:hypothetical protein
MTGRGPGGAGTMNEYSRPRGAARERRLLGSLFLALRRAASRTVGHIPTKREVDMADTDQPVDAATARAPVPSLSSDAEQLAKSLRSHFLDVALLLGVRQQLEK